MASNRKPPAQLPDKFTLLTMWLRLVSILNNNNSEISMRSYAEIKERVDSPPIGTDLEISEYEALDSMTAVLVQSREIISSCYSANRTTIMPLKFTIIANPSWASSEYFGVRIAKNGISFWPRIQDDGAFDHTWR
jgi:hypothetical protein